MGKDVYNPMQFLLSKWEPYPSVNITITNDDFDVKQNLIAQTTLHMDKLYSPSPTKWRAKWNKVTLRLASDKMKIILSYQAYNVGSSKVDKQVIRLRDVSEEDEPVVEERIEDIPFLHNWYLAEYRDESPIQMTCPDNSCAIERHVT
ncbi:unnamed protein product [Echinostoma caproni]|uniref:SEC63 domain-containing protein n=1 Tax=Echinostoma caproni TaxID=27848 RepID=A0A183BA80_9TREM|nr:unnamed protein product [Echinostoma caproni]